MTIDVPRLRKELEFITNHPESWRQTVWLERTACGTAGCLAGNVVLHEGLKPWWVGLVRYTAELLVDGREIGDVARELLGLTLTEAERLFNSVNTLYELWALASTFTNGEIEVPPDLPVEPRWVSW